MNLAELQARVVEVLGAAFVLGALFGAIAQRTHFCVMGALSDLFSFGDSARLRMWLLAIGVAIAGFNTMVALGWLDAAQSLYGGSRFAWASALSGGLAFGFGMVLASGCGSKNLVRLGGGSLKALVVCLVIAATAFATLRGVSAVLRVASVDAVYLALPASQDLPSLAAHAFGAPRQTLALAIGLAVGGALIAAAIAGREGRDASILLGGIGIGAVIVAAWWVSGQLGHVAEHPETLEETFLATNSRRMEAFSFVAPLAYTLDWLLFYSDASKGLTIGIVSCVGIVFGSAAQAIAARDFHWEGFAGVEDTANHLVGAALMGVGGITAMGCTIGQGLSGISTLGLTSLVAVAAIAAGGVAGLRYQAWRVARMS